MAENRKRSKVKRKRIVFERLKAYCANHKIFGLAGKENKYRMEKEAVQAYLSLLKKEISPAMGCTEPAAVALAVAYAADALGIMPDSIRVSVSAYIFKNGMNVGIPGTGMVGLEISAALGAISAEPQKQLLVLNDISQEQKALAKQMVEEKRVRIEIADTDEKLYIEVVCQAGDQQASALLLRTHNGLARITKNGEVLVDNVAAPADDREQTELSPQEPEDMTLASIVDFVSSVSTEEIYFLRDVISMNCTIAEEGLTHDYGLKVGKSILESSKSGLVSDDLANFVVACTAAAADARMSGCDKPVMSTAGSGNQGLTASLPVAVIGRKLDLPEDKILHALALSILVTIHTKQYIGRLSVLCGCSIAAAIGSCCGIIFLFDGGLENMEIGINSMVADISGVVCDGAKPGCALKIATAVNSAIRSASMALNGLGANAHDGIVTMDVEQTLKNLGMLGNEGMRAANSAILEMMLHK